MSQSGGGYRSRWRLGALCARRGHIALPGHDPRASSLAAAVSGLTRRTLVALESPANGAEKVSGAVTCPADSHCCLYGRGLALANPARPKYHTHVAISYIIVAVVYGLLAPHQLLKAMSTPLARPH